MNRLAVFLFAAFLVGCAVGVAHATDLITVDFPNPMTVDEAGGTHPFITVHCNVQPTGTVLVRVSVPSPLDEVAIWIDAPPPGPYYFTSRTLAFTPSDYSDKRIYLSGVPDSADDGYTSWQVNLEIVLVQIGYSCYENGDPRFCDLGPWFAVGHTCDDDGGNDPPCGIE